MSSLRSVFVVLLAGSFVLTGCGRKDDVKKPKKQVSVGQEVGFEVPSVAVEGKPVKLSDAKDKVVMISFWGTWDEPCRSELDLLNQLYADYKGRGFEIIGLVMDESVDADTVAILNEYGLTFPNGVAASMLKQPPFSGIRVYPTKFFLNREHQMVGDALPGVASEVELRQRIEELL